MPATSATDPITRWAEFSTEKLSTIGDLELAVLKVHVVLEDALKFVLAKRLNLPDDAFFKLRLNFSTLLKISLEGTNKTHLVGALRKLNNARNHISHRVEAADVPEDLKTFVEEVGRATNEALSWPSEGGEQLKILKECLDLTAVTLFEIALESE